jgi:hypothetical protein
MAKLTHPINGVTVRMYRQGHGDCFLLALPKVDIPEESFYVLIDCGYKPGSQRFVHDNKIGDIVKDISEATGHQIDLFIITHEHQDHLNGIWKKNNPYFEDFDIKEAWFAWTEHPTDKLAVALRKKHKDVLVKLTAAHRQLKLAAGKDDPTVTRIESLLNLEFGGESEKLGDTSFLAADGDMTNSVNKQAMKLVKDKATANNGVKYFKPGKKPVQITGTKDIRAFVLGPPYKEGLLSSEDPEGTEGFPEFAASFHRLSFNGALNEEGQLPVSPFGQQFHLPASARDANDEADVNRFIRFRREFYGPLKRNSGKEDLNDKTEVPKNADWRRIDDDWLYSAENLALSLNTGTNNTSLVLAFELPKSKKTLLFVGDAQRGNWVSWDDIKWKDGSAIITARDLLARTVLYKVGHHGSHNATLAGKLEDDYPNLSWMATGENAQEFTAMITAVNEWATTKNDPPWRHPLPSIKLALSEKAQGRVFQTDMDSLVKPDDVPQNEWDEFMARSKFTDLFFEYQIFDE